MAFTEQQLETFFIDPRRSWAWGICPFCGGTLLLGHRRDTGNLALAHSAVPDPTVPGAHLAGCLRFAELTSTNMLEFLRLLKGSGFRWSEVNP